MGLGFEARKLGPKVVLFRVMPAWLLISFHGVYQLCSHSRAVSEAVSLRSAPKRPLLLSSWPSQVVSAELEIHHCSMVPLRQGGGLAQLLCLVALKALASSS